MVVRVMNECRLRKAAETKVKTMQLAKSKQEVIGFESRCRCYIVWVVSGFVSSIVLLRSISRRSPEIFLSRFYLAVIGQEDDAHMSRQQNLHCACASSVNISNFPFISSISCIQPQAYSTTHDYHTPLHSEERMQKACPTETGGDGIPVTNNKTHNRRIHDLVVNKTASLFFLYFPSID
jgi:hypothetical protein